jgi:hypothetical protein
MLKNSKRKQAKHSAFSRSIRVCHHTKLGPVYHECNRVACGSVLLYEEDGAVACWKMYTGEQLASVPL